jgi:hypothetical protein
MEPPLFVKGIGKGRDDIQNLKLDEVYYAPDLTHNLVPGPDLLKKGYDLFFTKNRFKVLKESKVVATGTLDKTNKFLNSMKTECYLKVLLLKTKFVHETFGHYNINLIQLNTLDTNY